MKPFITLVVLLFAASNLYASPLKSYSANYRIKAFGMPIGKATRELKLSKDGKYELKMDSSSSVIFFSMDVNELSKGNFNTNQPEFYSFSQKRGKKEKHNEVHFDWPDMSAVSSYKGKEYVLPLRKDTQDKISYQLQLRKDLIAGKKTFHYTIVDEKKIETYNFKIEKHEEIKTPFGKIDTVKMIKASDTTKRSTAFWLAPSKNYLLVKLQHIEKGTGTTVTLSDIKFEE